MALYKIVDCAQREMANFRRYYTQHKGNAKEREVEFILTFEEWMKIWLDSGRWSKRGCKNNQYCMSRFGDKGAYTIGNVRIATVEENREENKKVGLALAERSRLRKGEKRKPLSEEWKEKIRKAKTGKIRSDETKDKIRRSLTGVEKSKETRENMIIAQRKRYLAQK